MFSVRALLKISMLPLLLVIAAALSACSTVQEYWTDDKKPELSLKTYTVSKGDTLYSIAWLYELDYRQLAKWNDVKAPKYIIYPGQKLRLNAPNASATRTPQAVAASPAVKLSEWYWPLDKPDVKALPRTHAVLMTGKQNELVRAASDGTVVYSGFNLKHYNGLIIIKHQNDMFSIYGNNKEILIKEHDRVTARQEIARLSDKASDAKLYFEIRRSNQSIKAVNYLSDLQLSIH